MTKIFIVLCAMFFILNCGISEEIYRRDMNNLKNQIADLEEQKANLINDKKKCNDELSTLRKERGSLDTDLQKALKKIDELKEIAEKRKAVFERLKSGLQSMVAAGKLKVKMERGQMIVEMGEKVLFDVGKSKLKQEGIQALGELTPVLISFQGRKFQIAGHTDNTGSDEFNWRLSTERALSVVRFMIEQGMPADRVSASGYGMYQPIETNETPEGRALNRRIEILLLPNLEELQIPEID